MLDHNLDEKLTLQDDKLKGNCFKEFEDPNICSEST